MGRGDIRITAGQLKKYQQEGRITELPKQKRVVKPVQETSIEEKNEHPLAKKFNERNALAGEGKVPWRYGVCRLFTQDARNPITTAVTTAKVNALVAWYVGPDTCHSPRIRFIGWLWEKEEDLLQRT